MKTFGGLYDRLVSPANLWRGWREFRRGKRGRPSDSRAQLVEARGAAKQWLASERRLRLKRPDAAPRSSRGRFNYLGYRVSRAGIRPAPAMLDKMRRRITELVLEGDAETIERSVASYRGVVRFGEPW